VGDALVLVVAGGEAAVAAGLLVPVGPVAVGPVAVGPVAVEPVGPVAVEPVGPVAVEPVDPVGPVSILSMRPLNRPSFEDAGTTNGFSGVPGLEPPR